MVFTRVPIAGVPGEARHYVVARAVIADLHVEREISELRVNMDKSRGSLLRKCNVHAPRKLSSI